MENDIVETVMELEASYKRLLSCGNKLSRSMDDDATGALCLDSEPSKDSLRRLQRSFTHFIYDPGQDPKTTIKYPGAIGCSIHSINLAKKLNDEKKAFAELFKTLSLMNVGKRKSFFKTTVPGAFSDARKPLRFTEISKICQKQATRLIPIAEQYPEAITWHWMAQPESITTTSKAEIIEQLMSLDGAKSSGRIQSQIIQIQELPSGDLKKSQVKNNPTLRVTYQWGKGLDQRSIRQASMPILFEWGQGKKLPEFKFHRRSPPQKNVVNQNTIKSAVGQLRT